MKKEQIFSRSEGEKYEDREIPIRTKEDAVREFQENSEALSDLFDLVLSGDLVYGKQVDKVSREVIGSFIKDPTTGEIFFWERADAGKAFEAYEKKFIPDN